MGITQSISMLYLMITILLLTGIFMAFVIGYLYFYGKNLFAGENNMAICDAQQLIEYEVLGNLINNDKNPSSKYYLFNNVSLPLENTHLKADHFLISTRGIFILETTHCEGNVKYNKNSGFTQEIEGNTQRLYTSSSQNKAFLDKLSLFLPEIESKHIHFLNVFTAQCEFSSITPSHVIKLDGLVSKVQEYEHAIPFDLLLYAVGIITSNRTNKTNYSPSKKRA